MPLSITDPKGVVYVHLASRPLSDKFTDVTRRAHTAMESAATILNLPEETKKNWRGPFITKVVGVSLGNGNAVCPTPTVQPAFQFNTLILLSETLQAENAFNLPSSFLPGLPFSSRRLHLPTTTYPSH